MGTHAAEELNAVASELERGGYDTTALRALQGELDAMERPPGLFQRLSSGVREAAALQWRYLIGELEESREAFALLKTAMGGRALSADERDKIRSQMFDLVRLFPAGLIAAANSAFPVPGTGLLTPWILRKLGLLPSRWREAHLLAELQKQHEKLEREGNQRAADRLRQIEHEIEEEALRREQVAKETQLLTHWDKNQNGVFDDDERQSYRQEVARLQAQLATLTTHKRWFFSYEGEVFGPLRLSEFEHPGESLLCCYDGKSGWIAVSDLVLEPQ